MRTIIEVLMTNNCNRNCSYCAGKTEDHSYSTTQGKINEMGDYKLAGGIINTEQLKRWLMFQKPMLENIQIVLTGGEPTIVRHYTELLDWLSACGFMAPIIYTNGLNIKDLANLEKPNEKAKVILTHHQASDIAKTKEYAEFLQELGIKFLVKVLTDKPIERPDFGKCKVVIEGIIRQHSKDLGEMIEEMKACPPSLAGWSPYKWRWNGHKPFIDMEWTPAHPSLIFTVFPDGHIVNCHFWRDPEIGSIYKLEDLLSKNAQIAWCYSFDGTPENPKDESEVVKNETVTRCEIQHYVNLMEKI